MQATSKCHLSRAPTLCVHHCSHCSNQPRFASGLLATSIKPCPPVACLFLVARITRTTCHILTHLSVGRTMLMVAHHHPVVVATTSSDSVTLAGCWARIALAGSGAAAMPEVGRSPCRGGSAYLPPSHLSNAILQPTANQLRKEEPSQIITNRVKTTAGTWTTPGER